VVVGATNGAGEYTYSDVFACGDALHLDPGCSSQVYAEVRAISSVCFFENCSPIFMPTKFYTYVLADENPPWISQHMHSVSPIIGKFLNNSTYLHNMIYFTA